VHAGVKRLNSGTDKLNSKILGSAPSSTW